MTQAMIDDVNGDTRVRPIPAEAFWKEARQVVEGEEGGKEGEARRSREQGAALRFGALIASCASLSWRRSPGASPPRHYGPWELFCSILTEGLVARGHDVTLFATGDSETSAALCSVVPRGWSEDPSVDPKVAECLHIAEVFERAAEFDIIHNSFDFLPLTYAGLISTPVITTIHGFSSPQIVPVYEKYNQRTFYVAISGADRHASLEYLATIHHGIETERFTLSPTAEGYLAFFGRIHRDKGLVAAIDTANETGTPLRIAGIIQDELYFKREIAPRLDGEPCNSSGRSVPKIAQPFLAGRWLCSI